MKIYKGFTLIELMILLAIIFILSSVAAPAYEDYKKQTEPVKKQLLESGCESTGKFRYSDYKTELIYLCSDGTLKYE